MILPQWQKANKYHYNHYVWQMQVTVMKTLNAVQRHVLPEEMRA